MRIIKTLFAWAVLLLCSTSLFAHDFYVGGIYYNITSSTEKTVEVTYGGSSFSFYASEYSGSVVIPETVTYNSKTYNVVCIGFSAFRDCSSLTSVTIPNSVTSIGSSAFYGCDRLASVVMGNKVQRIGSSAFEGCSSLKSMTIPRSVMYIEDSAFSGCSSLTSVEIPYGVSTIGDLAFKNCTSLKYLDISNSVSVIGNGAFENCSSLTSVFFPPCVESIGFFAFGDCSSLTSVVFGSGLKTINFNSFEGCSRLASVELNCKTVGDWFREMTSIQTVVFGDNVTSIGSSAFSGCSNLRTVLNESNLNISPGYGWGDVALYAYKVISGENVNGFYFKEYDGEYLLTGYWGDNTKLTLPETYNGKGYKIGAHAFHGDGLTSVVIPNSVTSISNSAFEGCYGLTSVVIGNSVTVIGCRAFYGCYGLTSVVIPNSVKAIYYRAFEGCSNLASVVIGNSVTSIEHSAFEGCSRLASVTIPNSVTSIDDSAFKGCFRLASVTIPNSVTSIGNSIFEGCSSLTSVVIGNGVTSIGSSAFSGCDDLTSVVIGNSVTSIGDDAFKDCSGLKSVELNCKTVGDWFKYTNIQKAIFGENVSSVASLAFQGCSSLYRVELNCKTVGDWFDTPSIKEIVLGENVTSIGGGAFCYLYDLTSVTIPNSVTSIGGYAFYDCCNLTTITIPKSVTYLGKNSLAGCEKLETVYNYSKIHLLRNSSEYGVVGDGETTIIYNKSDLDPEPEPEPDPEPTPTYNSIASLNELNNTKCYFISQPNHTQGMTSWAIATGGNALKSNKDLNISVDENDTKQQFAILSVDGNTYYLYHVGEEKFVNKDGSLGSEPKDAVRIKQGAYDKTFMFYFDNSHYINVGGSQQMIIDGWNTPDGGNSCIITPVGDFDSSFIGVPVTGVALDKTSAEVIVGESLALIATVTPSNASNQTITWTTSNASVATVDEYGNVATHAAGTATIVATVDGYSASCVVTVEEIVIEVTSVRIDPRFIWDKPVLAISSFSDDMLIITPSNATNKSVTWSISDTTVVKMDDLRQFSTLRCGRVVVTATVGSCSVSKEMLVYGRRMEGDVFLPSGNGVYTFTQPNHAKGMTSWAVESGGNVLKSNKDLNISAVDHEIDSRQQFAVLTGEEGFRYLYHVGEKKFVNKEGVLSAMPEDPIYAKPGAYVNTFVFYFDDSHYINVGSNQEMLIDNGNVFDGGNSCAVTLVTIFDETDAYEAISRFETGIDEVKAGNNKAPIIYDLCGRRVHKPTKGVYIIDGKKVFVK